MSTILGKYDKISEVLGVAQLVARSVRDAEVVGSSPITQTRTAKTAEEAFFDAEHFLK